MISEHIWDKGIKCSQDLKFPGCFFPPDPDLLWDSLKKVELSFHGRTLVSFPLLTCSCPPLTYCGDHGRTTHWLLRYKHFVVRALAKCSPGRSHRGEEGRMTTSLGTAQSSCQTWPVSSFVSAFYTDISPDRIKTKTKEGEL